MLKALALLLAFAGCAIGGYGVYVLTAMRDDQVEANCIARVQATPKQGNPYADLGPNPSAPEPEDVKYKRDKLDAC